MKMLSNEEYKPLINLVILIEKIVASKHLDKEFHQDEIEKYLTYLIQGEDKINPYERRQLGINDEVWQEVIKSALYFLNLKEKYAQIFKT